MKKAIIFMAVMAMLLPATHTLSARTKENSDSVAAAMRQDTLRSKKELLQNEIKKEDAKRNRQLPGVSAATMEAINDRQDSLCLALRSQLTDVTLELKEMAADIATPQLVEQFNRLVNRADSTATK